MASHDASARPIHRRTRPAKTFALQAELPAAAPPLKRDGIR